MATRCVAAPEPAPAPQSADDTVTVSRAEFEALKATVEELKAERDARNGKPVAAPEGPPGNAGEAPPPEAGPPTDLSGGEVPTAPATGGAHHLALPDISAIVQSVGKVSSDKRDQMRDRLRLTEAELAIQGYVYPDVKADLFITMSPEEGEDANVEEGYLTYQDLAKGLTAEVGRKHVPFDRVNLLHNHSWPYITPPAVLRNLVADESLTGDGLNFTYVLPAPESYFAQLDLGAWTGDGPGTPTNLPDIVAPPGAGFADKFYTARLWTSHAFNEKTEVELGGSYANGPAPGLALEDNGDARLTGVDLTYRHFGEGTGRLLLRGEAIWRNEEVGGDSSTAKGYYLFGNVRQDKYSSWGALWDWSEFPQSPELRESALSLIYTQQFSEQYYMRLQAKHGSRPGDDSFNELALQWVWGVGPHTHNLE